MVGPGWHAHLDLLRDRINGQTHPRSGPPGPLRERYTARLPSPPPERRRDSCPTTPAAAIAAK